MIPFTPELLPFVILGLTPIVMMTVLCLYRNSCLNTLLALLGLIGTYCSLGNVTLKSPLAIANYLIIDSVSLFFIKLILITGVFLVLFSQFYLDKNQLGKAGIKFYEMKEEYQMVLLLSLLGGIFLVCSQHMILFFLALELLTIPFYGMIAFAKTQTRSLEASLKYLILASCASAFILFGFALLFASTGSMEFNENMGYMVYNINKLPLCYLTGLIFVLSGLAFKLSAAPFHMWAGDVYEGSIVPTTMALTTLSKAAVLGVFVKFLLFFKLHEISVTESLLIILSTLSMTLGNFLAYKQKNLKRLLAYSSVTHMGYMLAAFVFLGNDSLQALLFYISAYILTSLCAFGVLSSLTENGKGPETLEDLRGLFWHHPYYAFVMVVVVLSLMGIPMTAGFIGKYQIIASALKSIYWPILAFLVVNAIFSLGYYLRILVSLLVQEDEKASSLAGKGQLTEKAILGFLAFLILYLGMNPSGLFELSKYTIEHLSMTP